MTDRELLELAAKAAGMAIEYDEGFGMYWSDDKFSGMFWNPLHNDGDALRLAVKLGLTICNEYARLAAIEARKEGV